MDGGGGTEDLCDGGGDVDVATNCESIWNTP
jgi:hypothetical protein